MEKVLQRKLKSKYRNTRYSAIDELVRSRSEETVSVLKNIAERKRRRGLTWYDEEDSRYALERLMKILDEDFQIIETWDGRDYINSSGDSSDPFTILGNMWKVHKYRKKGFTIIKEIESINLGPGLCDCLGGAGSGDVYDHYTVYKAYGKKEK